jgi:hypothetical protein
MSSERSNQSLREITAIQRTIRNGDADLTAHGCHIDAVHGSDIQPCRAPSIRAMKASREPPICAA